jgi:hypothetical protein
MGFRQGAAEDGEVLGEDIDLAAIVRAPARDHTIATQNVAHVSS